MKITLKYFRNIIRDIIKEELSNYSKYSLPMTGIKYLGLIDIEFEIESTENAIIELQNLHKFDEAEKLSKYLNHLYDELDRRKK